jgi:hypothetical protein
MARAGSRRSCSAGGNGGDVVIGGSSRIERDLGRSGTSGIASSRPRRSGPRPPLPADAGASGTAGLLPLLRTHPAGLLGRRRSPSWQGDFAGGGCLGRCLARLLRGHLFAGARDRRPVICPGGCLRGGLGRCLGGRGRRGRVVGCTGAGAVVPVRAGAAATTFAGRFAGATGWASEPRADDGGSTGGVGSARRAAPRARPRCAAAASLGTRRVTSSGTSITGRRRLPDRGRGSARRPARRGGGRRRP